jgi:pantoate--beta-alanine ligase
MWIARSKTELQQHLVTLPRPIVLVPTMGALHPGHAALIDLARKHAGPEGSVLVSIFVNPIQFDQSADLETYPRSEDADLSICKSHGADGVFLPEPDEMYFKDRSITVTENLLSQYLCGATRLGHFDGVCTVVLKLFNLTRCDAAIFGEKDFQQLAIIQRMVRDLDLHVQIIPHPTLREADGLAMSSRNRRLTPAQRSDASRIRNALLTAAKNKSAQEILATARDIIEASPLTKMDYLSLVDAETLQPTEQISHPTILACAVFYGEVRLIDHIQIDHIQNAKS